MFTRIFIWTNASKIGKIKTKQLAIFLYVKNINRIVECPGMPCGMSQYPQNFHCLQHHPEELRKLSKGTGNSTTVQNTLSMEVHKFS